MGGAWGASCDSYCVSIINSRFLHKNKPLVRICSYIAPPHAPPMLDHQFLIYFVSYLFGIEKMILVLHIWAVNNRIERNPQNH